MTSTQLPPPSARQLAACAYDASVETALLTLSPALLDALRKIAPKKRRTKVPYVITLALLAIVAVLYADPSTREFGVAKGRQIAARLHRTPATTAPATPAAVEVPAATAQLPAPAEAPAIGTPVVTRDKAPIAPLAVTRAAKKTRATSSPAARSGKPKPRPAIRQSLSRIGVVTTHD